MRAWRISLGALLVVGIGLGQSLQRYQNEVFTGIKVTKNVVYGRNYAYGTNQPEHLYMDIYEPAGDTAQKRPVIVLIHAGSFLPPYIASQAFGKAPIGTKEDSAIVELCRRYARRGYVAISATHRLGWNPQATTQEERAAGIIRAVWRAVQDGRALVRYLRKDAATTNQWRIDPDRIVMGGSSSGAYVGLHVAYLNLPSELNQPKFTYSNGQLFVDTTALGLGRQGPNGQDGGNAFEGGSGHSGYPSHIQAVLNLGGALGDTTFIQNEKIPVISFHGVNDNTTPYLTATVYTAVGNYPIIEVSGSHDIHLRLYEKGNLAALLPDFASDAPFPGLRPFPGVDFQPWGWYSSSTPAEKAAALRYIDTIMSFSLPRLFKVLSLPTQTYSQPVAGQDTVIDLASSLAWANRSAGETIRLYPTPANSPILTIESAESPLQHLALYTFDGRLLCEATPPSNTTHYTWLLPDYITPGYYLVKVQIKNYTIPLRWCYISP
jgi:hypothetical protein